MTTTEAAVRAVYAVAVADAEFQIHEQQERIVDLEAERDIYRAIATAGIEHLHRARKRIDYLEEQADRLFEENRLLRSRTNSQPGSRRAA